MLVNSQQSSRQTARTTAAVSGQHRSKHPTAAAVSDSSKAVAGRCTGRCTGGQTFLGFCSEGNSSTSSLMSAMVTTSAKGWCCLSVQPLVGSMRVSPLLTGIITSSGRERTRAAKSFLAEKHLQKGHKRWILTGRSVLKSLRCG